MKKNHQDIYITKSSGETTPFSYQKLKRSLTAAGASEAVIEDIIAEVENDLYQGISTKLIYKKAFALLKRRPGALAARYKLKAAIMELGPAGFAFEHFVGAILKSKGYQVVVSRVMQGHCVTHEVDVIATKGLEQILVECKFHSLPNYQCDVKIPLYIHSRFRDIEKELRKNPANEEMSYQGWIVTNTRFTIDAATYGTCAGMHLVSWNQPEGRSLKDLVEQSGIHPITSLTSLTRAEKQHLLESKVVLCKEIYQAPALLDDMGIGSERLKRILREAHDLCDQ